MQRAFVARLSVRIYKSRNNEVINARYNAQKPTIFSSNYSIAELASVLSLDKAIIERINEMATRVLKLDGDDFRTAARSDKNDIARRLGV